MKSLTPITTFELKRQLRRKMGSSCQSCGFNRDQDALELYDTIGPPRTKNSPFSYLQYLKEILRSLYAGEVRYQLWCSNCCISHRPLRAKALGKAVRKKWDEQQPSSSTRMAAYKAWLIEQFGSACSACACSDPAKLRFYDSTGPLRQPGDKGSYLQRLQDINQHRKADTGRWKYWCANCIAYHKPIRAQTIAEAVTVDDVKLELEN